MRYQGITGGRVTLDYSSMVSAFFYRLNLTNPDPSRSELPRLTSSNPAHLVKIRDDLQHVLARAKRSHESTNWRDIVDMIVTRYTDRLQYMVANATSGNAILSEVNFLLNVFTDYSVNSFTGPDFSDAIKTCSGHYLKPVTLYTEEDHMIHAAIFTVSQEICRTLYGVRAILPKVESVSDEVVDRAKLSLRKLIVSLAISLRIDDITLLSPRADNIRTFSIGRAGRTAGNVLTTRCVLLLYGPGGLLRITRIPGA